MSDLRDKLLEIKRQKDEYILPENIKKDVTVYGVTGTLEASQQSGNLRLYATKSELLADTDITNDVMGIVYQDTMFNLSPQATFNKMYFPQTFTLEEELKGEYFCDFNNEDSIDGDWEKMARLNFEFHLYDSGPYIRVNFENYGTAQFADFYYRSTDYKTFSIDLNNENDARGYPLDGWLKLGAFVKSRDGDYDYFPYPICTVFKIPGSNFGGLYGGEENSSVSPYVEMTTSKGKKVYFPNVTSIDGGWSAIKRECYYFDQIEVDTNNYVTRCRYIELYNGGPETDTLQNKIVRLNENNVFVQPWSNNTFKEFTPAYLEVAQMENDDIPTSTCTDTVIFDEDSDYILLSYVYDKTGTTLLYSPMARHFASVWVSKPSPGTISANDQLLPGVIGVGAEWNTYTGTEDVYKNVPKSYMVEQVLSYTPSTEISGLDITTTKKHGYQELLGAIKGNSYMGRLQRLVNTTTLVEDYVGKVRQYLGNDKVIVTLDYITSTTLYIHTYESSTDESKATTSIFRILKYDVMNDSFTQGTTYTWSASPSGGSIGDYLSGYSSTYKHPDKYIGILALYDNYSAGNNNRNTMILELNWETMTIIEVKYWAGRNTMITNYGNVCFTDNYCWFVRVNTSGSEISCLDRIDLTNGTYTSDTYTSTGSAHNTRCQSFKIGSNWYILCQFKYTIRLIKLNATGNSIVSNSVVCNCPENIYWDGWYSFEYNSDKYFFGYQLGTFVGFKIDSSGNSTILTDYVIPVLYNWGVKIDAPQIHIENDNKLYILRPSGHITEFDNINKTLKFPYGFLPGNAIINNSSFNYISQNVVDNVVEVEQYDIIDNNILIKQIKYILGINYESLNECNSEIYAIALTSGEEHTSKPYLICDTQIDLK